MKSPGDGTTPFPSPVALSLIPTPTPSHPPGVATEADTKARNQVGWGWMGRERGPVLNGAGN